MGALGKAYGQVLGLASDYASRMKRAQDMGFDTSQVYYHGTGQESIDAIKGGDEFWPETFFMTPDISAARSYAEASEAPTILEVYARPGDLGVDFDLSGGRLLDIDDAREYVDEPDWDIQDFIDRGYSVGAPPQSVRSIDAAFDPAKKSSANLMAGVGGAAILGGGMVPQDAAASTPQDSIGKDMSDIALEVMSALNEGVIGVADIPADIANAILQIMDSDTRVPRIGDQPLIQQGTAGGFMEEGDARQAARLLGSFASPI